MTTSTPAVSTRRGTPVVPGVAYGPVVRPAPGLELASLEAHLASGEPDTEAARYAEAVETVAARLAARTEQARDVAADVLRAQTALVQDKGLRKAVQKQIAGGASAEAALVHAVEQFAVTFEQLGGLMAERITDLRDLGTRVAAELQGLPEPGVPVPDEPSVLLAHDLAPADTALLDPERVIALATSGGGPTSHTAIIARQLGLPCVVAVPVDDIENGSVVLVDGGRGEVLVAPPTDEAEQRIEAYRRDSEAAAAWRGPGATADGVAVQILANVADGPSARTAAAGPSEGVGLFRTELAFLGRDTEPTVAEQADIYAEVLTAFGDRKVVVRTLDAGSDKPMKFVTVPGEDNPALGVRGFRLAADNPQLLDRQLDAIAQAAERTGTAPWVMAPMVATPAEAKHFGAQVRSRGMTAGVMVEVPSAALLADQLLEHVDFLSIGTNDLTQYTMAADRLSSDLATFTDAWQPAVLRLVQMTAAAGQAADKPVGVCGEAAADPSLACVLVGLGVTSLSMAASALGQVGAAVGQYDLEACCAAADAALAAPDNVLARSAANAVLGR